MIQERLPDERPPWEPRTRFEMESEITALRAVNKRLGDSLSWIVDVLLQDDEASANRDELKKNRKGKSRSASDAESAYNGSEIDSDNTDSDSHPGDPDDLPEPLVNGTNASNPNAQPLQSTSAQLFK